MLNFSSTHPLAFEQPLKRLVQYRTSSLQLYKVSHTYLLQRFQIAFTARQCSAPRASRGVGAVWFDWLGIASAPLLVNPKVMNLSTAATLNGESRCAEHCIALSVCYNVFKWLSLKRNSQPHMLLGLVQFVFTISALLQVPIRGSWGFSDLRIWPCQPLHLLTLNPEEHGLVLYYLYSIVFSKR